MLCHFVFLRYVVAARFAGFLSLWIVVFGKGLKDVNHEMDSSLDRPDDILWHDELDFNFYVAGCLEQAYASLYHAERSEAREESYLDVYKYARKCQGQCMSHRQLMLVHYLIGTVFVKLDGDYSTGFEHFVTASDLAQQIGDKVAVVKLAQLAGSTAHAMLNCFDATECLTESLRTLRDLPQSPATDSATRSQELDLLLTLAGDKFLLGEYERAQYHLEEARILLPGMSNYGLQEATIDWVGALLLRWQGRTEQALNAAFRASDAYARLAASPAAKLAFDRLSPVIADIALDLAESRLADGYESDRDQYVALARPHMMKAIHLASEVQDLPGWGLAELTRIRFERVAGYVDDGRIAAIDNVIKIAHRLHDVALLGQAQTALGYELASLGRKEQARNRFRKALNVFKNSEVPAMGVWARRALLNDSEMRWR